MLVNLSLKMKAKELNQEIANLIKRKDEAEEPYSIDDIEFIQQYVGDGGLIREGVSTRGTLYEYYTPLNIVEKMWGLVYDAGFSNGMILEPSIGIGRFIRYIDPAVNTVDAYEYSKDNNISFRIAQISFPFANITNDYFESIFYEGNKRVGKSNIYDLVIGNPPYGEFSGAYAGNKREGNKTLARTYEQYFMWAGIELLKQGGLLCYIIPSTFLDNSGSYEKFKDLLFEKSELIDAYRMPKGAFDKTDLQTDIILLRKK